MTENTESDGFVTADKLPRVSAIVAQGRYVRTARDKRQRARGRQKKKGSFWICPGCGVTCSSGFGLSLHLQLKGDTPGACAEIRAEWRGERQLKSEGG
ncbi:MAG: hypothetical protein L3K23_10825 [Thermoplasmata archaeon]|nr:hypothetical protein [Thermoplasmata archaeon]